MRRPVVSRPIDMQFRFERAEFCSVLTTVSHFDMLKARDQQQFCRACLKEIRNPLTATYILQSPELGIELDDNVLATSYLQCYYFCLGRDIKRLPSMDCMVDYDHICLRCKEVLLKSTKFIINSRTSENFLMAMFYTAPALDDENAKELKDEKDDEIHNEEIMGGSESELVMNEEYLESTEMEEQYNLDSYTGRGSDAICNQQIKVSNDDNINDIETFEEIVIEVAKQNCELEQTTLDVDSAWQINEESLERFLYFSCEFCTKIFYLERRLYEHYENEHDQKSFEFPCDICRLRHVSFKALRYHRHTAHKNLEYVDCEICGKAIVDKFYESHREQHSFNCEKCDQTFRSKYAMDQHIRIDHEIVRDKRYDCPECDRFFYSSENLKLHSMTHNNNLLADNGYSCYICAKSFTRPMQLKQHLQWHRGDTMKCTQCSKEFTRLKDIELHIRQHITDFPYKCDICQQRFAYANHLSRHMRKHNTAVYSCPLCDKTFISSFYLRHHSYHHSGWPLTCSLCNKGCTSLYLMRRHLKRNHLDQFGNQYSDDIADTFYKRHDIKELFPRANK